MKDVLVKEDVKKTRTCRRWSRFSNWGTEKIIEKSMKKVLYTWIIKSQHWCLCWLSQTTCQAVNWEPAKRNAVYNDMILWVRWKKLVKLPSKLGPEDVE